MALVNNGYKVGTGNQDFVIETAGHIYVKLKDVYYELNFNNITAEPVKEEAKEETTAPENPQVDYSIFTTNEELVEILKKYVSKQDVDILWSTINSINKRIDNTSNTPQEDIDTPTYNDDNNGSKILLYIVDSNKLSNFVYTDNTYTPIDISLDIDGDTVSIENGSNIEAYGLGPERFDIPCTISRSQALRASCTDTVSDEGTIDLDIEPDLVEFLYIKIPIVTDWGGNDLYTYNNITPSTTFSYFISEVLLPSNNTEYNFLVGIIVPYDEELDSLLEDNYSQFIPLYGKKNIPFRISKERFELKDNLLYTRDETINSTELRICGPILKDIHGYDMPILRNRGKYNIDPNHLYERGDIVEYNGDLWECTGRCINNKPPENYPEYWRIFHKGANSGELLHKGSVGTYWNNYDYSDLRTHGPGIFEIHTPNLLSSNFYSGDSVISIKAEDDSNNYIVSVAAPFKPDNKNATLAWGASTVLATIRGVDITATLPPEPTGGGGDSTGGGSVSVYNYNPTLSWERTSDIASIGGTNISVTMPSNPCSVIAGNKNLIYKQDVTLATVGGVDIKAYLPIPTELDTRDGGNEGIHIKDDSATYYDASGNVGLVTTTKEVFSPDDYSVSTTVLNASGTINTRNHNPVEGNYSIEVNMGTVNIVGAANVVVLANIISSANVDRAAIPDTDKKEIKAYAFVHIDAENTQTGQVTIIQNYYIDKEANELSSGYYPDRNDCANVQLNRNTALTTGRYTIKLVCDASIYGNNSWIKIDYTNFRFNGTDIRLSGNSGWTIGSNGFTNIIDNQYFGTSYLYATTKDDAISAGILCKNATSNTYGYKISKDGIEGKAPYTNGWVNNLGLCIIATGQINRNSNGTVSSVTAKTWTGDTNVLSATQSSEGNSGDIVIVNMPEEWQLSNNSYIVLATIQAYDTNTRKIGMVQIRDKSAASFKIWTKDVDNTSIKGAPIGFIILKIS